MNVFPALAALMLAVSSPAAAPAPLPVNTNPSPYFLHLNLVPLVSCQGGSGSAFVVDTDTLVTANHVIESGSCTVWGSPVEVLFQDRELDYAVIRVTVAFPGRFVIDCAGYQSGNRYYAAGWAGGADLVMQKLDGTDGRMSLTRSKVPWQGQALLRGSSFAGMSGGPIVDERGFVVGIVNGIMGGGRPLSISRELKDTYLCSSR